MQAAISETERRRAIQQAYNEAHGITPTTIEKAVRDVIEVTQKVEEELESYMGRSLSELTLKERADYAKKLDKEMREAAQTLQFERAAVLRDRLLEIRSSL
jgi:excinuclease ABC subunit B